MSGLRHPNLTLVFDENISHRIVAFLREESRLCGFQHHRQAGWTGLKDSDWMPIAIHKGWVMITSDRNEKTRKISARDIKLMGGKLIMLGPFWDKLGRWDKAKWLVTRVEKLVDIASQMHSGEQVVLNYFGNTLGDSDSQS